MAHAQHICMPTGSCANADQYGSSAMPNGRRRGAAAGIGRSYGCIGLLTDYMGVRLCRIYGGFDPTGDRHSSTGRRSLRGMQQIGTLRADIFQVLLKHKQRRTLTRR